MMYKAQQSKRRQTPAGKRDKRRIAHSLPSLVVRSNYMGLMKGLQ